MFLCCYILLLLFHFYGLNCAILFVNPHRGLFFVVGRSQRCEAPARPVYMSQYMWHPRRAVRLCAIVPDPHPTGCMHPGVVIMWGVAYHRRCVNSGGVTPYGRQYVDKLRDRFNEIVRIGNTDNARIVPTVVRCWALFPYRSTTRRQAQ